MSDVHISFNEAGEDGIKKGITAVGVIKIFSRCAVLHFIFFFVYVQIMEIYFYLRDVNPLSCSRIYRVTQGIINLI